MNTRQLNYILTLERERSFSAAAKKLMVSQPSLSQMIKKIEEELGITLFDRSVTPFKLTEGGKVYINAAKKILEIEKQMLQNISDIAGNKKGKIIVGVPQYRSAIVMPKALELFHKDFPGFDIKLVEKSTEELEPLAENGELDLALIRYPADTKKFNAIPIMEELILLAVPSNYNLETEDKTMGSYPILDIRKVKDMPFIVLGEEQQFHRLVDEICAKAGFTPRKIVECGSIESAHTMVEKGIGATLITSGYIDNHEARVFPNYYAIKGFEKKRKTVAIYRKDRYLSIAEKRFIECLTM